MYVKTYLCQIAMAILIGTTMLYNIIRKRLILILPVFKQVFYISARQIAIEIMWNQFRQFRKVTYPI